MGFSNNMSRLLNKIERYLGTRVMNLPEHLSKDTWSDIIKEDTLITFSRYYPNIIRYNINKSNSIYKDGFYYIDEDRPSLKGVEILGVRDISWETLGNDTYNYNPDTYFFNDIFGYSTADVRDLLYVAGTQINANIQSFFKNGIYVEFKEPNMLCLKDGFNNIITDKISNFDIDLLIVHSSNLNTIPSTAMGIFEELAMSDVAIFLFNELKYFDGLDTIYGNIDLKLSDLEKFVDKREDVINKLKESYISFENTNQPMVFTV